ncbi:hypothetical protein [Streptomyces rhizosphaericus]|uniref:hypothetical protein n=1 Tax=Streptomyces rhizosphaericus TaxID=114699 RepID=UPI000A37A9BD|nr:hypothetical protein [Streptomyces rhizosphaericus]
MPDTAPKYAVAFGMRLLNFFSRLSCVENAEAALATWVPTGALPDHQMCLTAVMFRSRNGVNTLTTALALADDTGHLIWNPEAMGSRTERRTALCDYWDWGEEIRPASEAGDRLIRAALPLYGVDAEATDLDLARELFSTTLADDECGRSRRIRQLRKRLSLSTFTTPPAPSSAGDAR